jgi:L-alanine-DL-glutamate epimerase-like enolase superfamily enzyme
MGKIATIEYFRVPPRWLFVKITDADGNFGWGEASLEGHTQAVEGCLDAWTERYVGFEAEYGFIISPAVLFSMNLIRWKTLADHVIQ